MWKCLLIILAMQVSDLKTGMYLTNTGSASIPLYDSKDGTGTPFLTIQPGQMIGQVVDFSNGPAGQVIYFTSDAITAAEPVVDKLISWLPGVSWVLAANFSDIVANVDDTQVTQQAAAIQASADQGASLRNALQQALTSVKQAVLGDWSFWEIGGVAVGIYVLLHWKTFFKSR